MEILEEITEILKTIESTKQVQDIEEINEIFQRYEQNRQNTISEISLPAWMILEFNLISPPIVYKNVAIRMGVNLKNPFQGTHINTRVFPCDDSFDPIIEGNYSACITTNEMGRSLIAVFAHWDFISRVSIPEAIKHKIITPGWIENVFRKGLNRCKKESIGRLNERYVRFNAEIEFLEQTLNAREIPFSALEGEGSTDSGGRYYNSWFEDDKCTCCNQYIRSPSRKWPWSQFKHIKSMKHKRNAAIYLLKMMSNNNEN